MMFQAGPVAAITLLILASACLSRAAPSDFDGSVTRAGTNNLEFESPGSYRFVVVTVSSKFAPTDGDHNSQASFAVTVNGERIDTVSHNVNVHKGGSKGHYWGYESFAVSQRMAFRTIKRGDFIKVNFIGGNLHISSDIKVDLSY